ncbi:hypothetical protein CTI12_AA113160 [Artemisia annua]|uniref:Uncharacterized protein n=1 Tax=Artemisia annua TaxID=35608 RepID=A0A2U1PTP1_ARTAN|nr:hypothetical protein CTI12_AA113160 [Artemisia annua]
MPYVHNSLSSEQILPDYFEEYFKSENDVLYMTGNDRLRYKTVVAQKEDRWALWDLQWQAFVSANVPDQKSYIHFVKQGQDDYYVTVYAKDGSECVGYDRRTIGPWYIRCLSTYNPSSLTLLPGDFIQDIWQPSFKLIYSTNMIFYVKNERVKPLAFTNMERYTLSVVVIGRDGLGLSKEDIGFQLPKRPPRPIFFRDQNDLRLEHLCSWAHHADHENEDHVIYTRFTGDDLKLVYDFDETLQLHKYTRAKHVHRNVMGNGFQMRAEIVIEHDSIKKEELLILKGDWDQFGKDYAFQDHRMLRLKLVRIDKRYVGGADDGVPIG